MSIDALERLRAADPAGDVPLPLTADDLLHRFADEPATPVAPSAPQRVRTSRRTRIATVLAAAAVVIAVPVLWPGSTPTSSTAFAVTRDGDEVHVTVPRDQLIHPEQLQAALTRAGVRAVVMEGSADCAVPAQDGLPAGYDVAPPDLNVGRPDPAVQRFTFLPDRMPAGTTLLFGLDRFVVDGDVRGISLYWELVDHVPACVPRMWADGTDGTPTLHPAPVPTATR
jgi:hypothetical protein